jgi:putative ABC transport system permease protein
MNPIFAMHYAWRSLWREGQRTFLALVCVAFGVMSLVAMQLLAADIRGAIEVDPYAYLGGDAQLTRPGSWLHQADLAELEQLRSAGVLRAYSPVANNQWSLVKNARTNAVYMLTVSPMGVDASVFPLVGQVRLIEPVHSSLAEILETPRYAAITQDLASKAKLRLGDELVLGMGMLGIGSGGSVPQRLTIAAIMEPLADRRGDTLLYSLDTARLLSTDNNIISEASVLWGAQGADEAAVQRLRSAGWRVVTVDDVRNDKSRTQVVGMFDTMLKGAGILGLLVGGLGVASTMQVLMARRNLEIAMLKTMGYQRRNLLALFGTEAALLGLGGSVVGTVLAVGLGRQLEKLLSGIGIVGLQWAVDVRTPLSGVVVGTCTAVIMSLAAIVPAGAVRPSVLLRQLPANSTWRSRLASGALYASLLLVFGMVCAMIMRSVWLGLAVIAAALAGLAVLGSLLGGMLWLLVRLPVGEARLLKLAQNYLKGRQMRAVFALIALFMGILSIGYAAEVIFSGSLRIASQASSAEGPNLLVYAASTQEAAIRAAFVARGASTVQMRLELPIQAYAGAQAVSGVELDQLEGVDADDVRANLNLDGQPWGMAADAAYLPESYQGPLKTGAGLTLVASNGQTCTVHVAGVYAPKLEDNLAEPKMRSLLVSAEVVRKLGDPGMGATFLGTLPIQQVSKTRAALSQSFPDSIVLTQRDIDDILDRFVRNLFGFAVGMAGLALVAGAVLIANSVGLAMVERKRELGIFKAVGFSRGHVLTEIVLEHGLLGLVAGAAGMAAVAVACNVTNRLQPSAKLVLNPGLVVIMVAVSIAIAIGSAAAVAWHPVQVRPLEVLREE